MENKHLKKNRWDDFRKRRAIVLDKYLAVKRTQKAVQQLLRYIITGRILLFARQNVEKQREYRAFLATCAWISVKFVIRTKMLLRKHGSLKRKRRNDVRVVSTFVNCAIKHQVE